MGLTSLWAEVRDRTTGLIWLSWKSASATKSSATSPRALNYSLYYKAPKHSRRHAQGYKEPKQNGQHPLRVICLEMPVNPIIVTENLKNVLKTLYLQGMFRTMATKSLFSRREWLVNNFLWPKPWLHLKWHSSDLNRINIFEVNLDQQNTLKAFWIWFYTVDTVLHVYVYCRTRNIIVHTVAKTIIKVL